MVRKLMLMAAPMLVLTALISSAQPPVPEKQLRTQTPASGTQANPAAQNFGPPAGFVQPLGERWDMAPMGMSGFGHFGGVHGPELELARQSQALVKQMGKATGDEKDKLKTKLTETLEKQFDMRQKRHEKELAALEAQVKKLKDMVQKRQDNRRDIISRRIDQLLRDAEGLGW
jgi:hypothetical protein